MLPIGSNNALKTPLKGPLMDSSSFAAIGNYQGIWWHFGALEICRYRSECPIKQLMCGIRATLKRMSKQHKLNKQKLRKRASSSRRNIFQVLLDLPYLLYIFCQPKENRGKGDEKA